MSASRTRSPGAACAWSSSAACRARGARRPRASCTSRASTGSAVRLAYDSEPLKALGRPAQRPDRDLRRRAAARRLARDPGARRAARARAAPAAGGAGGARRSARPRARDLRRRRPQLDAPPAARPRRPAGRRRLPGTRRRLPGQEVRPQRRDRRALPARGSRRCSAARRPAEGAARRRQRVLRRRPR